MAFTENNSSNSSTHPATQCSSNSKGREAVRANWEAEKRLVREDARRDMEEYAVVQSKEFRRAQWEDEGDRRTLHCKVQREVGKLREVMEEELEKRRWRLSELLCGEEEAHLRESMQDRQEDPDAKSERMLSRYLELKTKKEEERQRIAEEKREQQFKLNCDDLRARVSRRLQQKMAEESRWVASENRKSKAVEEEVAYSELWRWDAEAKQKKDAWEEEERRRKAKEFGGQVAEQMEEKRKGRWKELLQKEEDAEIRAEHNRLLALEAECAKEAKRRSKENMRSGLDACLKSKMRVKAQEAREDILEDIFFSTQAMEDEEDKAAQNEKKNCLMREQQEFLQYLRDRSRREHEQEEEADKLCQEVMDREWSRRQEEGKEDKRRRKMAGLETGKGVQEQISDNMERLKRTQCVNREYANKVLEEDEDDMRREEEKRRLLRERNRKYQKELLDQIRMKKEKLEQEKNLENSELEELRRAQEWEETKIRHLVGEMKIDSEHPYRVGRREVFDDCGGGEA